MTGIAQCKKCQNIYKFPIIDDSIPPCPICKSEGQIDDGGFLVNSLNPDDMYSIKDRG